MKQGVLQDESMEIHVASMSNSGKQQEHEETEKNLKKTMEKKNNTKIENKTQVWTKNLTQTKRMDAPKVWIALDTN